MYANIGKSILVRSDKVLAILDLKTISREQTIKQFLEKLRIEKYKEISQKGQKSLILVQRQDNKIGGYISNISSITLAKRLKIDVI